MNRRSSKFRGFTLIELVLVMVIIAIMSVIVVPTLTGFTRGRSLTNTSSQLMSVAGWARAHAISDGVEYRLNFDMNARQYWLTMQFDDGSYGDVGQEMGQPFTFPAEIDFSCDVTQQPDGQYVEFYPSGLITPVTVRMIDTASREERAVGTLSATEMFHVFTDNERQTGSAI